MNWNKLAFYFVFTIIFCAVVAGNSTALRAEENYTVDNILVDATGADATAARSTAIQEGQMQAFSLLMQKFNANTVTLSPDQVARLVQGFQVKDERIASTRYQAMMTVAFSPPAIQRVLQQYKQSGVISSVQPILLLPVYKQSNSLLLWEENPWHDALAAAIGAARGAGYKLPLGDLADASAIDAVGATSASYQQLEALATKYDTAKILVLQAEPMTDSLTGKQWLQIRRNVLDSTGKTEQLLRVDATAQESPEAMLKRAAIAIIAPAPAPAETALSSVGAVFTIKAHFSSLGEWRTIWQALKVGDAIGHYSLKQISTEEAIADIRFQGNSAQLIQLLAQKGLAVHQEGDVLVVTIAQ